MRNWITAALAAGAVCSYASATLQDLEPNDTMATATVNGVLHGADAGVGLLDVSDVDFYSFELDAGTLFTASIFDFTPQDPFDNDSLIALFDAEGAELLIDDDGGPGYLSSLSYLVSETAVYYLAISGYGDDGFEGSHGENFAYKLVVNSSPVPGPSALAALAGAVTIRSRRRRA